MNRLTRDEYGLRLAEAAALRAAMGECDHDDEEDE